MHDILLEHFRTLCPDMIWRSAIMLLLYIECIIGIGNKKAQRPNREFIRIHRKSRSPTCAAAKSMGSRLHISRDLLLSICAKSRRSCGLPRRCQRYCTGTVLYRTQQREAGRKRWEIFHSHVGLECSEELDVLIAWHSRHFLISTF